ncbi:GNAT family N-acetyltransferase, partial [Streptococcus suis]
EWKESQIKIAAQSYLEKFYQSIGFETISEVYLEDDIPHLDMLYSK